VKNRTATLQTGLNILERNTLARICELSTLSIHSTFKKTIRLSLNLLDF